MTELLIELFKNGIDTDITLEQTYFRVTLYDTKGQSVIATDVGESPEKAMAKILGQKLIATTYEGLSLL